MEQREEAAVPQDSITVKFKDVRTNAEYEITIEKRPRESDAEFRKRATAEIDAWLKDIRGDG